MNKFKSILISNKEFTIGTFLLFCTGCLSPKIRELKKENEIQKEIHEKYTKLKTDFIKKISKINKEDGKDCWDEFLKIYDLVMFFYRFFLKEYDRVSYIALEHTWTKINSWLISINRKRSPYLDTYIATLMKYNELYENPLYKKYIDNEMTIYDEKNKLRSKGFLHKLLR